MDGNVNCLFSGIFGFTFLLNVNPEDAIFIKTSQVISAT